MKELLPILLTLVVWSFGLCNTMAIVAVDNSRPPNDRDLMYLLRCMFFIVVHQNIQVHVTQKPGVNNIVTDALSCDNLPCFLKAALVAANQPTPIPAALVIGEQSDLLSRCWAQQA